MSPVSATYWSIPGYVIFWVLFAVAFGLFLQRFYLLYRLMRLGKQENRFDQIGQRIKNMLVEVVPQWCTLKTVTRKDLAGLAHALLFWSFSLFFISYIIFIGLAGGFGLSSLIERTPFETVYFSILDIAAVLVTLTLILAAVRRYIIRPPRLEPTAEAGIILIMVFSLMALHVLGVGFDHAARGVHASWPPLGAALAGFLSGTGISQGTLEAGYRWVWWLHYLVILSFMVYIPRSKHLHILASLVNAFFKPLGPKVALEPIPLEALEAPEGSATFGASKIQDFTWKDLLDFYACAECGRCHVNCPAQLTGKSLSPREVIHHLKEHLLEAGPGLLANKTDASPESQAEAPGKTMIGDVVTEEEIWACTTCGACQEVCPVNIEHIRKIIDLRRNLVMAQSKMPESAQLMLRNMQQRGHPWAGVQSMRLRGDWTSDLELKILAEGDNADTLFWVGCTGALVERNVKATLSMTRVLKAGGVDFAVLGDAETCCGDPARRAGYEFQFQMMAEQNIELFKSYNIKEIITTCPHCYNTIKHEYPRYGGDFKVVHYTELIADLISQGKLKLINELNSKLTYHDPCYLGRYNSVYSEPRRILQAIPKAKLEEMERSRDTGFCCGGGGGLMWIEEQPGTTKINQMRIEDVIKTGVDTVVAACPYCLQMFEDAIDHKEMKDSLKARDLVELVEEAMKQN
ncbi:MAG: 4Fe-4S dicluster domain-containing protein [Deltaproteobacteria bacterium]|nr:4Fe-4S dicluster domain-containing protein [Deltaproteobacteria bacterium]